MKHLGDITKISGHEAPIVDCVIGGSPCQDLSIAGRRAGLAGERSGLYMEQIRIIKELREQDVQRNRANGRSDLPIRPRYMVWENVPGAFSSNKGKDFAAVLEEAIRIAEPQAPDVPVPPKGWPTAGTIVGDGWSVAWRTHDAQFWGVPQRRKRISLIADFGGRTAPEILFECKSLPRDCERLQGFPDGWTDIGEWIDSKGKKHDSSDSARYKALGNSIALPFWRFLCKRISAQYARKATMASLFDGIGGFPLVWEEWNGKGSAVWASEIEPFPIAVTKYHFGEE